MNWNDFASTRVRIEYANMSKVNRIRAWARRNNAVVDVQRYAHDAYEGYVKIPMTRGRDEQNAAVAELKAFMAAL